MEEECELDTNNTNGISGNNNSSHNDDGLLLSAALGPSISSYGWTPSQDLSIDDNLLDLLLIVTRNSICIDGSMGCILAQPLDNDDQPKEYDTIKNNINEDRTAAAATTTENEKDGDLVARSKTSSSSSRALLSQIDNGSQRMMKSIVAVSINRPLYTPHGSDIHAEVCAVSECARQGRRASDGCTAYVTKPPCKNCLSALVMSGIKRIVYFTKTPDYLQEIADKHQIVLAEKVHNDARHARVEATITGFHQDHQIDQQEVINRRRKQRKEAIKQRQERKRQRRQQRIPVDQNNDVLQSAQPSSHSNTTDDGSSTV